MATRNTFLSSPFDNLLPEDNAPVLPGQQATQPQVLPPLEPEQPKPVQQQAVKQPEQETRRPTVSGNLMPPAPLRPIFEAAAKEFNVPVNVLMALGHQESRYNAQAIGPETKWGRARGMMQYLDSTAQGLGINPFAPEEAIPAAARQIRERLDKGYSMEDAVKEHFAGQKRKLWGKNTDAYGREVMEKVGKIGEAIGTEPTPADNLTALQQQLDKEEPGRFRVLTPEQAQQITSQQKPIETKPAEQAKAPEQGSLVGDIARMGIGGVYKGLGSLIEGVGKVPQILGDYTTTPLINAIFGTDHRTGNLLQKPAEAVRGYGQGIQTGISKETAQAIKESTPDGNLFEPSTWTFGKAPSVRGYMAIGADVLGGMVPVIAASVATGGASAAVRTGTAAGVGGAQGGGAASQEARDAIESMAKNGTLEKESAYYRELLKQGNTPEQALVKTRDAAERWAFMLTAPVSAAGGAATSKIISPAERIVSGGNLPARIAGRAGLSSLEEGTEETLEKVQTKSGINRGAGTNINPMEGTFGDFVLGAVGGAGPGAVAGGLSQRQQAAPVEPAAQVEPVAPEPVAPVDRAAPTPQPTAPTGPLSKSVEQAAEPDVQRATITAPEGQITGFVDAYQEDGQGNFAVRMLGDDGQVYNYTNADQVAVNFDTPKAGPLTAAVESVAATQPEPVPEPAPVVEPAAPQETTVSEQNTQPAPTVGTTEEGGGYAQPTQVAATQEGDAQPVQAEAPAKALADMAESELRERMKDIAAQAKANGGWNKMLTQARKEVEKEINSRANSVEAAPPQGQAPEVAPAADVSLTNEGKTDQLPPSIDTNKNNDLGAETAELITTPTDETPPGTDKKRATALKRIESGTAFFGTPQKANDFIAKNGLKDTHTVEQTGKVRFEVKPIKATNDNRTSQQPASTEAVGQEANAGQAVAAPVQPVAGQAEAEVTQATQAVPQQAAAPASTQPDTPLARAEAELADWKARRDLPANAGNVADVDKEIGRLEQTIAALREVEQQQAKTTAKNAKAKPEQENQIIKSNRLVSKKHRTLISEAKDRDVVSKDERRVLFDAGEGMFNGDLHIPTEDQILKQVNKLKIASLGKSVEKNAIAKYEQEVASLIDEAIELSAIAGTLINIGTRKSAQAPNGFNTAGLEHNQAGTEYSNSAANKLRQAAETSAFLEALKRRNPPTQEEKPIKETPLDQGSAAFSEGKPRTPPPSLSINGKKKWLAGWDAANVATPVESPASTAKAPILQNRNRATPSSIAQMQSIASQPDYGRLGFSRDFANGAPVVAGGTVPANQLGREDVAVAADGRRIPVQYAVVEAGDVLPSNQADGTPNPDYGDQTVQRIRAIAGNGRVAGMQAAYRKGTAAQYQNELASDMLHGVGLETIRSMREPVLVRVMPVDQVTDDIGDVSNTVGNLTLSPVEQANNDAQRIDLEALKFAEDGGITAESVRQFVRAMPQAEQGGLIDTNGQPTKQAVDRINAAVFAKAYGNDELIRLYAQAQDPEARLILSALAQVASKMARLENAGALDFRSLVTQAAEIAVTARRNGVALNKAAQQLDMAADPDVSAILDLFAANPRNAKPLVEALGNAADFAYTEANKPGEDMFGAVPRAGREDVINKLSPNNERASQEDLEVPAGGKPVASNAVRAEAKPTAAANPPETEASRPTKAQGVNPPQDEPLLTAPTREDVLAQQEAAEAAQREKEAADRRAAEEEAKRRERDEIRRRSEAAADTFELGQDPMDNLTGQKDIFAAPAVSQNTIFTEDAAEKARALLKRKLMQLNSGIDPEIMQAGITLAGYHIEKGARTFAAYAKAMVSDLGEVVKPYLKSWYMGVKYDPRAAGFDGISTAADVEAADVDALTAQENDNVPSANARVERDSQKPTPKRTVGNAVPTETGGASGETSGFGGQAAGKGGGGQPGGDGVPTGGTVADGNRGDFLLPGGDATADLASVDAGSDFSERGGDIGLDGVSVDPVPAAQVDAASEKVSARLTKEQRQRAAENVAVKPGDIENIKATLPYLMEGQQEDVLKTETRFAQPDGYGMLFTNGTGTGKTFTGLGVVKRFQRQGKNNILIVVPDDKIAADWMDSSAPLGLNVSKIKDTKDAGKGIVVTTYANLGENDALARRQWDLVVADEAHTLMQSADGKVTGYLSSLRAITYHPDGVGQRHLMLHREDIDKLRNLSERIDANNKILNNLDTMDAMMVDVRAENARLQKEADALAKQLREKSDAIRAEVQAAQGASRTRLLALSATPFAYEFTVDWANGYLFDYNEGQASDRNEFRGYNQGSNRDRFFMAHFGYSMRYNKLTKPDASKVDTGLLQRNFNGWLRKKGSLSGRMLDVPADYDRRFVLVESGIGNQIDDALNWASEKSREDKDYNGFSVLHEVLNEKFDYLSRRYLLEAIKATEVVPIVRQHMALGRKVVVFHDYKKGGGFNPFDIKVPTKVADNATPQQAQFFEDYKKALMEFRAKFKSLVDAPLSAMASPIDVFKREFPDVLLVNGDEKKSDLLGRYKKFQDDDSGPQVMLVQSAKNKGWSGHDTTGKHQRVLINLGQPTAPTLAIQQEGRIYRTGQVTDAIMRYLNTGTTWEKMTFASTIAGRASTAENLGMGEQARALKDSFISAFEESDTYPPGHEGEGKGGKERDKLANSAITAYDRAKTYYWATQKKNSSTKAQEGKDYFATPEPVGYKMAEWLGLRGGESALEPSAGHGAIARWLPEITNRTVIEPSNVLRARLAMAMDASKDRIIDNTFENHAVVNKYDGIAMNPPFGVGGKTAIEHLAKAATHLRDGGRIVALIPTGPAADKRFDQWMYGESERPEKPVYTHPEHGPIYKGDTIETSASWAPVGIVRSISLSYGVAVSLPGKPDEVSGVSLASIRRVNPTGQRTEKYRATGDIYTVAEIKLPQVTFERAGTSVATRIVVLEKQTDSKRAPNARGTIDLSGITDIRELFDRMEDLNLPVRSMTASQQAAADAAKAEEERQAKKDEAKNKPKAANQDAVGTVDRGGEKIIKHVTAKGKTIRGIVRTDLLQEEAKKIDPYTFRKNGGWFIREVYLKPAEEAATNAEPRYSVSSAGVAMDKPAMSVPDLRESITAGALGIFMGQLINSGSIVLHKNAKTLPNGLSRITGGVQAVTAPNGTIHVVASAVTRDNARAVTLHEMFHRGGQALIGTEQWGQMMGRLGSLYRQSEKSSGKAREFFDRARERVAAAKSVGAVAARMEVEEFGAYAIEEYESAPATLRKWVDDLIGMVKAWVLKRFGKQLGQLTPAQLSALAKFAVMDAVTRPGPGPKYSVKPEEGDKAIDEASKALDNTGPVARDDYIGRVVGDIGAGAKFIVYPRTIAAIHPEFTPVYNTGISQMETRDEIIADLGADVKAYHSLEQTSKENVNKVLELGRLMSTAYTDQELRDGVTNTGMRKVVVIGENGRPKTATIPIASLLSGNGEIITLNAAEITAYKGLRAMFDRALDMMRNQALDELGFPELKKEANPAQAARKLADAMPPDEREKMANIAKFVAEIEQAKRAGYVPFARYGDYVVTVKEKMTNLEYIKDGDGYIIPNAPDSMAEDLLGLGAQQIEGGWKIKADQKNEVERLTEQTIYSAKVETGLKDFMATRKAQSVEDIPAVREAIEKARREWIDGNPARRIVAFKVREKKSDTPVRLSDVDALAEVASIDNATWDAVRNKLADAIQARSFRKHFFHSDNVPGYTGDFERAIADYVIGMSGYLSRRQHMRRWDNAVSAIKEKPKLFEYASKYRTYVNDPQEEMAMVRQIGFFSYIAGVIATALVNLTQVPFTTVPVLSQIAPTALVLKEIGRAYKDAMSMMGKPSKVGLDMFDPTKAPADVRDAVVEAWAEGAFVPLESLDLMMTARQRNVGARQGVKAFNKATQVVSALFTFAERLNRLVTFIAAARIAQKPAVKKNAHQVLAKDALARQTILGRNWTQKNVAEFMVDESQFRMGKANRPTAMRGVGSSLMQFKGFMLQQFELWYRMASLHGRDGKLAMLASMAALMAVGGLWAFPGSDDLRKLIEAIYKQITEKDLDIKTELRAWVAQMSGSNTVAQIVTKGASYPLGVDMTRVGMGSVIPDSTLSALGIPFDLLVGRPKRAFEKASTGDYLGAGAEFTPNFVKNALVAGSWSLDGVRDKRGNLLVTPDELTGKELAMKSIGFQPSFITDVRDYEYAQRRQETAVDALKRSYTSKIARTIAAMERTDDPDELAKLNTRLDEIYTDIHEHNSNAAPEQVIEIGTTAIRNRVARELEGVKTTWGRERTNARGAAEEMRGLFGLGE